MASAEKAASASCQFHRLGNPLNPMAAPQLYALDANVMIPAKDAHNQFSFCSHQRPGHRSGDGENPGLIVSSKTSTLTPCNSHG
jgi:hypothetical protein